MGRVFSADLIGKLGRDVSLYQPLSPEHARFHMSTAQNRWLFGGNQSGKTYSNMMDLALLALNVHPNRPPSKAGLHWCATESWELVRDVLWDEYLRNFIPPNQISNITKGQIGEPRKVILKNGHVIEFKAFNQGRKQFQSRKISSFHGDEQCLSDFQGIFEEIQARLLIHSGGISWSLTPVVGQPYLEQIIETGENKDSNGHLLNEFFYINLNWNRKSQGGYIEDERVDQMIDQWSEETKVVRVEGHCASYFGAVYKDFSRGIHVVDPFKIPKDWRRYRGIDFGFTHPFCCLWVARSPDDDFVVYREYYQKQRVTADHAKEINRLSKDEEYECTIADPENAEGRKILKDNGIRTKTAKKDLQPGIEKVQSKLKVKKNGKPGLTVFRDCTNTIREFMVYSYPKNPTATKDKPEPKNDHAMDVIRYILYTLLRTKRKGKVYA